jgi:ABC-type multidrug transport system ATPase subunit
MDHRMSALSIEQRSVRRGSALAVRGVDLAIDRGIWFGLIGANGSGKTSLLRAIAGRLPINGGRCLVDGDDLTSDRAARARHFGFAPPADTLSDALRVRELLELVGGDLAEVAQRLGTVGAALGIDALLGRWVAGCSAGMRQRIAIALAFAQGQRLVILDEPFNWLDPVAAFDLKQALRTMVGEGLTLVTALHDLGTLVTACDEGVMLAHGRVALRLDRAMLENAAQDPHGFEHRTIDLLRSGSG